MTTPIERNNNRLMDRTLGSLSFPAYKREAERLREEIAGAKDDILALEVRAVQIREMLPKLETELLICERDAAEKKLEIIEKRALLAQKEGQR